MRETKSSRLVENIRLKEEEKYKNYLVSGGCFLLIYF